MLHLLVGGLIDKFAKAKALQAIEELFNSDSCIDDLCLLATKFVSTVKMFRIAHAPRFQFSA